MNNRIKIKGEKMQKKYLSKYFIILLVLVFIVISCSEKDLGLNITIKKRIPLWENNVARTVLPISKEYLLIYKRFEPFYSILSYKDNKINEIVSFGYKGRGPDELINITSEIISNDTIFIVDFMGNKIVKFLFRDEKLSFIKTIPKGDIIRQCFFNNYLINTYYGLLTNITLFNENTQTIIEKKETLSKDPYINILLNDFFLTCTEKNLFAYYPLSGKLRIYDEELNKIEDIQLTDFIKIKKKIGAWKKNNVYIMERQFYNFFIFKEYLIFFNHHEDDKDIERTEFYLFDWNKKKFLEKVEINKNIHFVAAFNDTYIGIGDDFMLELTLTITK